MNSSVGRNGLAQEITGNRRKLISVVCPVFNERDTVPLFYDRLLQALGALVERYDFELLFTNNRSVDGTLEVIRSLREKDRRVEVITLSRNFGYQASVLAGLTYARGDAIIVIDVDCEDPPEMLPQFIAQWEYGFDVVYGKRDKRPEFFALHWLRKLFYRLLHLTADSVIILDMAEFALVSSQVRDQMISNASTFPFLRTEIGYAGFNKMGISYTREVRIGGKTHYNLLGMTLFAIGGILSSSTFLLRAGALVGALLLPLNLFLIGLDFWRGAPQLSRFALLCDATYLVFFVSVLCAYTARIYHNSVKRPVFIVDWKNSDYDHQISKTLSGEVGTGLE